MIRTDACGETSRAQTTPRRGDGRVAALSKIPWEMCTSGEAMKYVIVGMMLWGIAALYVLRRVDLGSDPMGAE